VVGQGFDRPGESRQYTIAMSEPYTAIQIVMMPRDTNPFGTIFGGVILSYIDMAGATAARREVARRGGSPDTKIVTVALNRVEFKQPVFVGDVVRFETSVVKIGRTSITMRIHVVAERAGKELTVTDSEAVFVGVGDNRQPVPLLPARPAAG
jgi:acyl-CoA thioesterase YciA